MNQDVIRSRDNQRFKGWLKWAGSLRERRKAGKVMLEGIHLLETWESGGQGLAEAEVLLSESALKNAEIAVWQARHPAIRAYVLADHLFAHLAEAETPQGILAWATLPLGRAQETNCDTLVLDGIQDPGNLGTLLRTAAAAGFMQVILSPDCASPWSGKAMRAGQGVQCLLSIHEQTNLCTFLADFQGQSLATGLQTNNELYTSTEISVKQPLAWIFGSEGRGISSEVLDAADLQLKIPMSENVESLNVAAAAAICLFEVVRLRQQVSRSCEK